MKKRHRVAIVLILICISVLFIVLFSVMKLKNKKSDGVEFVIGMSQANLSEPWRILMDQEIKEEAAKHKNIKVIFRDAGGDTGKQANDINELVKSGINLLIVSLNDSDKLTPVVSKVYKSIPVIVLDRAVEGYDYSLYIGPDNESIGKQAGELTADIIGSKDGNVIEVQGALDSPPVVGRSSGFRDVLKDHKNINIYRTVICNWQRDEAEDEVLNILKNSNDIDVIFAHDDFMAYGAYMAVKKLGLKDIKIIGVDGLPGENGGLDLVKDGIIQGTFTCSTGGKEAVYYACKILQKKDDDIPKKIILRSDKVTKDNVDEYLKKAYQKPKVNKKITLGYAQLTSESRWRDTNEQSIKDAAKKSGINLVFLKGGTTENDEKNLIRKLIKRKVDVISFSPVVMSGWNDVLNEAKEANIPVIISDRTVDSDTSLWRCNIGSDFYEEGRRAARSMLEYFKDSKRKVNVFEIKGNYGSTPTVDRSDGFSEVIEPCSNFNLEDYEYGDFTFKSGETVMKRLIERYGKKINVVYAQNDDMALGAIKAIKGYGLIPGKDILVIGNDATRAALWSLKKGDMYCTVECNPLIGTQLMNTAVNIENGVEVPLRIINPEDIFANKISLIQILKRKY